MREQERKYIPRGEIEINPKFRALSNQIQKMVMNNEQPPGIQADLDEESKSQMSVPSTAPESA